MTADETARAGERRRQQPKNAWDRDAVEPPLHPCGITIGGVLTAMTPVPALNWPVDLFADTWVTLDDDDPDGELLLNETACATAGELPCGEAVSAVFDGAASATAIWWRLPVHGPIAGVTP